MATPQSDGDHYATLQVRTDATKQDITKAYRKLAMNLHPDKNKHSQATQQFQTLHHAYEILSDDQQRSQYDAERAAALSNTANQGDATSHGPSSTTQQHGPFPQDTPWRNTGHPSDHPDSFVNKARAAQRALDEYIRNKEISDLKLLNELQQARDEQAKVVDALLKAEHRLFLDLGILRSKLSAEERPPSFWSLPGSFEPGKAQIECRRVMLELEAAIQVKQGQFNAAYAKSITQQHALQSADLRLADQQKEVQNFQQRRASANAELRWSQARRQEMEDCREEVHIDRTSYARGPTFS